MDEVPAPEQDLAWRLANIEGRLEEIGERLGRLESSLRGAVADEVRGATAELRRAISELGRRLVQDLPHELARHRDAIVAELRPPPPPPTPVPEHEPPPDPLVVPDAEAAREDLAATDPPEAPGNRRAHRLRRRQG